MIIDLAAFWLIVWLLKNATMDVACAIQGKPNPRYEAKKAAARAAGRAEPSTPRYGGRDWFADLLADGLQAQTEWRRRKAAEKRQARDEAELEQTDAVDPEVVDVATVLACTRCTRGVIRDGRCDRCGEPYDRGRQPAPQTSGPSAGGAPDPEQQQPPRPRPAPDSRPDAQIIPFRTTDPQEETVSTDTEVFGLDQSIAYARSLKNFAGEHGMAGNEGYIGHLTSAKVEGAALQTAHDMQEAFANAAAAAETHADELEKQKALQEQYDANPDAGDKEFQTGGR